MLMVVFGGGLTMALVRAVVERSGRTHARTVVTEPPPSFVREVGEAWGRGVRWSEPAGPPAPPSAELPDPSAGAFEAEPPPESEAVQAARRVVTMAIAGHPGTMLTSLECAPEPCGAVVVAADLRELRAAVLDVTAAYNGHVDVDVRERDDVTGGHVFEAAVAIGTPTAETVAALDSEF